MSYECFIWQTWMCNTHLALPVNCSFSKIVHLFPCYEFLSAFVLYSFPSPILQLFHVLYCVGASSCFPHSNGTFHFVSDEFRGPEVSQHQSFLASSCCSTLPSFQSYCRAPVLSGHGFDSLCFLGSNQNTIVMPEPCETSYITWCFTVAWKKKKKECIHSSLSEWPDFIGV